MSIWVCPHCPKKSAEREIEKIEGLARLYAYPCEPQFKNGGLVILDSGAFGLSQSGGHMNFAYMQKLSQHYEKYYRDGMMCIAPDVATNPIKSMMNFKKWHDNDLFPHITPVLQSDNEFNVSFEDMISQAEFYKQYSDTICFTGGKFSGKQSMALKFYDIFKALKKMRYRWIHKLGAGWNIEDVKIWKSMPYLDSFDSISYYNTKNINEFGSLDALENVKTILGVMQNEK